MYDDDLLYCLPFFITMLVYALAGTDAIIHSPRLVRANKHDFTFRFNCGFYSNYAHM